MLRLSSRCTHAEQTKILRGGHLASLPVLGCWLRPYVTSQELRSDRFVCSLVARQAAKRMRQKFNAHVADGCERKFLPYLLADAHL